jgi:short-subunit dehydrogenase
LAVNFFGVVYGIQTVLPIMRNQGSGHVINISSGAAMFGLPYASIYAATKAAIARFSEALRYELEDTDIHVSVIYPDFTSTDMALEVALDGDTATRTVRSLSPQWVREHGSPRAGLQSPDAVARAVLACARRPRKEVYLSGRIRFCGLWRRLFPAVVDREASRFKMSLQELLTRVEGKEIQKEKTPASQNCEVIH